MTGKPPFEHVKKEHVVYVVISRGDLPRRPDDSIPEASPHGDRLWRLLLSCWAYIPEHRPGIAEVELKVSRQTIFK